MFNGDQMAGYKKKFFFLTILLPVVAAPEPLTQVRRQQNIVTLDHVFDMVRKYQSCSAKCG
jgi:hypothetical protein